MGIHYGPRPNGNKVFTGTARPMAQPPVNAFNTQSVSSLSLTLNGYSRTGTLFVNGDLATGINYGTQNSTPFAATDLNQYITSVYSNAYYNSRTFSPALTVLMERGPQGGSYPSNMNSNWECSWWLTSNGYNLQDILVCVFDQSRTITSFNVINSVQTYNNVQNDTVHFTMVTGTAASPVLTSIGSVAWGGNVTSQTLSVNQTMQAFAVHRQGATSWSRLENIRII